MGITKSAQRFCTQTIQWANIPIARVVAQMCESDYSASADWVIDHRPALCERAMCLD